MNRIDAMILDNENVRYPVLVLKRREEYTDGNVGIYFSTENDAENILFALASKDFSIQMVGGKFCCDFLFHPLESGKIVQSDRTWITSKECRTEIQCIAEYDNLAVDGFPPIFTMEHEELWGSGIHAFKDCLNKSAETTDVVFSVDDQGCRNVRYVQNHTYKYRCRGYLTVW